MVGAHQDKESTAQQPSIIVVIVIVDDEIYQAADGEKEKRESKHVVTRFYHSNNRIMMSNTIKKDTLIDFFSLFFSFKYISMDSCIIILHFTFERFFFIKRSNVLHLTLLSQQQLNKTIFEHVS